MTEFSNNMYVIAQRAQSGLDNDERLVMLFFAETEEEARRQATEEFDDMIAKAHVSAEEGMALYSVIADDKVSDDPDIVSDEEILASFDSDFTTGAFSDPDLIEEWGGVSNIDPAVYENYDDEPMELGESREI